MRDSTTVRSVDDGWLDHVCGGGPYVPSQKTHWNSWGHIAGGIALNPEISEGSQQQPERQA